MIWIHVLSSNIVTEIILEVISIELHITVVTPNGVVLHSLSMGVNETV